MYKKITVVAIVTVLATISVSADVIMNTIFDPGTQSQDRSNLNAPAGQTFKTGTLTQTELGFIDIQAPRDTLNTNAFYIAVYNDIDQNASTWDPGSLLGVSSSGVGFTALNAVSTWSFSGITLSDDTVFGYKLVTDATATTDLAGMRVGFDKDTSADTQAIHGGAPFGSSWDIATTISTIPEPSALALIVVGAGVVGLTRRRIRMRK